MRSRAILLLVALAGLPVAGEEPAAAAAEEPRYAVSGWTPPREASRGCVVRKIQPPAFAGRLVVRFSVDPGGKPAHFAVLATVPAALWDAIWAAVRACEWVPGTDADGKPVTLWLILPFRFGADNPAAEGLREGVRNPSLARQPREASPGCLRLHFGSMEVKGMWGSIAVRFRVTPQGVAEEFSFAPEDVPAATRLELIDAFSTCAWEPGLDQEGKPVAAWVVVPVEPRPQR